MSVEQNSFITNRDRFLSEVINGILPKCSSVDILVGYFYYSGFDLIENNAVIKNMLLSKSETEDLPLIKNGVITM